jgi:hypothetical protein
MLNSYGTVYEIRKYSSRTQEQNFAGRLITKVNVYHKVLQKILHYCSPISFEVLGNFHLSTLFISVNQIYFCY